MDKCNRFLPIEIKLDIMNHKLVFLNTKQLKNNDKKVVSSSCFIKKYLKKFKILR
jgi:hypothetical protein